MTRIDNMFNVPLCFLKCCPMEWICHVGGMTAIRHDQILILGNTLLFVSLPWCKAHRAIRRLSVSLTWCAFSMQNSLACCNSNFFNLRQGSVELVYSWCINLLLQPVGRLRDFLVPTEASTVFRMFQILLDHPR